MLADQLVTVYDSEYKLSYQELSSLSHPDSELMALVYFNRSRTLIGEIIEFIIDPAKKARADAAEWVLNERATRSKAVK